MDLNSSSSGYDDGETSASSNGTPRKGRRRKRQRRTSSPIVLLSEPQEGDMVWAKVKNHRWWPAIIVNKEDCGKLGCMGGRRTSYFVYWYGDGRVSPIAMSKLVDFRKGFKKFIVPEGNRSFRNGVYMAVTEIRKGQNLDTDDWDFSRAFAWGKDGFPLPLGSDEIQTKGMVSQHVRDKLQTLRMKYEETEDSDNENTTSDSSLYLTYTGLEVDLINSVRDGKTDLQEICLVCVTISSSLREHPLFSGSICEPCLNKFLERLFSFGLDLVAYHCCICLDLGDVMVCSKCYKVFCCKCIIMKATPGVLDIIREAEPWLCFLCEPYTPELHGLLKPRSADWKRLLWQMFHCNMPSTDKLKKESLRILCLDGSCETSMMVLAVLQSLHVKVDTVYLCNFDAKEIAGLHGVLPKNVRHLKSMKDYEEYVKLSKITPVQIVIASSRGEEMDLFGSYFFSFHNIISMLDTLNQACIQQSVPMMWVFEALPPHLHEFNRVVTRYLEFEPAMWHKELQRNQDDNLVWTNIPSLWTFLEGEGASQIKRTAKLLGEIELKENHTMVRRRRGRPRCLK